MTEGNHLSADGSEAKTEVKAEETPREETPTEEVVVETTPAEEVKEEVVVEETKTEEVKETPAEAEVKEGWGKWLIQVEHCRHHWQCMLSPSEPFP